MEEENGMSLHEMKKMLEEANLLEDNMSSTEIFETCQVILESKSAGDEESNTSKLMENQKLLIEAMEEDSDTTPNLDMDVVEQGHNIDNLVEKENGNSQDLVAEGGSQKKVFQDATKLVFGFNDMPEPTGSMLTINKRTPKDVPFHCTKKFLNAGLRERAKMVYQYHTYINKLKASIARRSFNPAPMPKEIILLEINDDSPTNSEEVYNAIDNLEDVDDETYISRSGRHTKRKLYCDYEEDSSDVGSTKKTKAGIPRKSPPNKLPKKQEDIPTSEVEPAGVKEGSKFITISTYNIDVPPIAAPKTASTKKFTNADIMSRSSLFRDSPRQSTRSRPTRTELMFEKLRESEEEKQKSEEEMEQFNKSLSAVQDDDFEKEVIMVEDEVPLKVRVVPPIPGRKPINGRRKKVNERPALDITIKPWIKCNSTVDTQDTSVEDFPMLRRRGPSSKNKNPAESTSQANSSKASTSNDVICPLCSKSFSQSKIVGHAADCGV